MRRHYLRWRAAYLIDEDVPPAALLIDETSKSSSEEAVNTIALMHDHGWSQVLIVSDPPHLWRLNWIWCRLAGPAGIDYRLVAAEASWWNPAHWWDNQHAAGFVLMELIKIVYYEFAHRRA